MNSESVALKVNSIENENYIKHLFTEYNEPSKITLSEMVRIKPCAGNCLVLVEMPIGDILFNTTSGSNALGELLNKVIGEDAVKTNFYLLTPIEGNPEFKVGDRVHVTMEAGGLDPAPEHTTAMLNELKTEVDLLKSQLRIDSIPVNRLPKTILRFVIQMNSYSVINSVGTADLKVLNNLLLAYIDSLADDMLENEHISTEKNPYFGTYKTLFEALAKITYYEVSENVRVLRETSKQ